MKRLIFLINKSTKISEIKSDKYSNPNALMKSKNPSELINCIVNTNKVKKDVKWCKEVTKENPTLMNIKKVTCNQKVNNNQDKSTKNY